MDDSVNLGWRTCIFSWTTDGRCLALLGCTGRRDARNPADTHYSNFNYASRLNWLFVNSWKVRKFCVSVLPHSLVFRLLSFQQSSFFKSYNFVIKLFLIPWSRSLKPGALKAILASILSQLEFSTIVWDRCPASSGWSSNDTDFSGSPVNCIIYVPIEDSLNLLPCLLASGCEINSYYYYYYFIHGFRVLEGQLCFWITEYHIFLCLRLTIFFYFFFFKSDVLFVSEVPVQWFSRDWVDPIQSDVENH